MTTLFLLAMLIMNARNSSFRYKLKTNLNVSIFITSLKSPNGSDVHTWLLSKLEQDKNITVKALTTE